MTKKELRQVEIRAVILQAQNSAWREGQAFFNALYELHPKEANLIRGSSIDMYHNNKNIQAYKQYKLNQIK